MKNYITPAGAARLKEELHRLLRVERPQVVNTVAWAAGNGDRSENGDYIYGKRRLREIDRRIGFLNRRLDSAEVIDPKLQVGNARVVFGATVTVEGEDGQRITYQIVGIDEVDVAQGRISWKAPLAKALLGRQKGDVVQFQTPKGEREVEIVQVTYS